jgi:hypothetical protein
MDRIEKEINDLLEQLDDFPGERGASPVSLDERRRQRRGPTPPKTRAGRGLGDFFNAATLMLIGAGMVVVGLLASAIAGWLIWVSFTGIVVFFLAFALSFWQSGRTAGPARGPRTVYWRDRYIEYEPGDGGTLQRVKRWFRRG